MSFDAETYRRDSLEGWEASAVGWVQHQELVRRFGAPVSEWLVAAIDPQPGERVLELAAGVGDTGMLAAARVRPTGGVIVSDQAEAMLDGARARAAELGLENVEFKALNAEWIDLPLASVDAVTCRWGYMLMADPAAALAETRRVLRPGGRLALAVWDTAQVNPWAALPGLELRERGLAQPSDAPGMFSLSEQGRLRALLEDAGFTDVAIEGIELVRRHANFDEMWQSTLDISRSVHDAVMSRPAAEVAEIEASLRARFEPFTDADGALAIPARTLAARADA